MPHDLRSSSEVSDYLPQPEEVDYKLMEGDDEADI
jgi:hypothetical protein